MKRFLCGLAAVLVLSASVAECCPVQTQAFAVVAAPQYASVAVAAPACAAVQLQAPQYVQQSVAVQAAPQIVQSYSLPLALPQFVLAAPVYAQQFAVVEQVRVRKQRVTVRHGLFGGTKTVIRSH